MINEEIVSKRYADAFLSYAAETVGFDSGLDELLKARRIIHDNNNLKEFLEHLEITNAEKGEVIDTVFGDGFTKEARQFLKLLVEKKRIYLFTDIAEYARLHYAQGAEADALLKTSYPLDDDVIRRIKDALEHRTKKKLRLYLELDADLVGGAYAQIGNIVIDGSIRGRLEEMREKLNALKVV